MLHRTRFAGPSMLLSSLLVVSGPLGLPRGAFAQTVAPEVATPQTGSVQTIAPGTLRQQEWLKASINERIRLSEQLGEEGARHFAKSKGFEPIMDGTAKALAQGPDQVYRATDGAIHVFEAKGGSGQLGYAYGYPQGSAEWAVESAKRVLRCANSSAGEKEAAAAILDAAKAGRLYVDVIRTSHVLGEPVAAVLEQSVRGSESAAALATNVIAPVGSASVEIADGVTGVSESVANGALRNASRVVLPVAIAVDGGLRIKKSMEIERQFASGMISEQQRELAQARNVAGMAGGWGGAWAGAELGAIGGGTAGTAVAPGPGTAVGAVVGGAVGGVAGYIGGEAAAQAASDWTVTRIHASGRTITGAASRAWSWTSDGVSSAWKSVTGK